MERNYVIVTLCIGHINATHVMQPNNCGLQTTAESALTRTYSGTNLLLVTDS